MDFLVDTDVLVRRVHRSHPEHGLVRETLKTFQARGEQMFVGVQNLYELWTVCTRPTGNNGLGLSPVQTDRILLRVEGAMTVLRDPVGLYDEWRRLVVQHGVSGRNAHDTRLVAAMRLHGVKGTVTFNVDDFRRYSGIQIVHPREV